MFGARLAFAVARKTLGSVSRNRKAVSRCPRVGSAGDAVQHGQLFGRWRRKAAFDNTDNAQQVRKGVVGDVDRQRRLVKSLDQRTHHSAK